MARIVEIGLEIPVGETPGVILIALDQHVDGTERLDGGVEQGLDAGLAAERRLLVALRGTEETRKKLNAFFEGQR